LKKEALPDESKSKESCEEESSKEDETGCEESKESCEEGSSQKEIGK
jgi:hypothetical protein